MPLQQLHRVRRFLVLLVEAMRRKNTTECNALLAALEETHEMGKTMAGLPLTIVAFLL